MKIHPQDCYLIFQEKVSQARRKQLIIKWAGPRIRCLEGSNGPLCKSSARNQPDEIPKSQLMDKSHVQSLT